MDGVIAYPEARTAQPAPRSQPAPGMPPESPVPMPEQRLDRFDRPACLRRPGALALAAVAAHRRARRRGGDLGLRHLRRWGSRSSLGGLTLLEALVLVLFAVNFAWIAITFVSAAVGAVIVDRRRGRSPIRPRRHRRAHRRAHADLQRESRTGLRRDRGDGLRRRRARSASQPSTGSSSATPPIPDVALAEEAALIEFRARLGDRRAALLSPPAPQRGAQGRQHRRFLPALGRRLRLSARCSTPTA